MQEEDFLTEQEEKDELRKPRVETNKCCFEEFKA